MHVETLSKTTTRNLWGNEGYISCLSLFEFAANTDPVERRIKEIGIYKVLGASAAGLVWPHSADFVKLLRILCLLSFPIAAWIMHNRLQQYTCRVMISFWIFAVAAMLALLIALITISFQAIKAAIANP